MRASSIEIAVEQDIHMKKTTGPTFNQVSAWCEEHDNHSTESWLAFLLDGSITLPEMRQAILEGRAPKRAKRS